jgi:hypothetical protein
MGFLRRLFGGGGEDDGTGAADVGGTGAADVGGTGAADRGAAPDTDLSVDEAERAHELELARLEAARLDELQQRQLRFADYAWTPPAQGGERRADDEDRPADA